VQYLIQIVPVHLQVTPEENRWPLTPHACFFTTLNLICFLPIIR
jgi:hypothetical protein